MTDPNDSQDKLERSVYITNLSFKMNNEDLEKVFSQVGKVEASHCFFDKELLRPAGRGIVLFSKKEEAQRAIKELDEIAIKGRKIKVQKNTKSIKLLNFKKNSDEEDDKNPIHHHHHHHHSNFPDDRAHDNPHLKRMRHRLGPRPHDLHRGRPAPINDYDYYDYDLDYDYHRVHPERDRIRERIPEKSRHGVSKYNSSFDHDFDPSKPRMNIKEIERKPVSRFNDLPDEKKPVRIEYNDREPIIDKENGLKHIYLHVPPPPARQPPPPPPFLPPSMIPMNPPVNPNVHNLNAPADDSIPDIGNGIPHSIWVKVIKKRSHDIYNDLYSITKDHQIIKDKVLLRFQPNEAAAVTKFVDALAPTLKA